MDLAYWGFQHWPFTRTYAADRFFSSPIHDEAFARLLFLVEEHRRSGVLLGPAGTGKTFLMRLLQQRAERLGRLVIRYDTTGRDAQELVAQIAIGCHVSFDADASQSRIWSALSTRFSALALVQRPLVVLLDHFDPIDYCSQQVVCRLRQLADSVGLHLTLVVATRDRSLPVVLQELFELKIELAPWTAQETEQFIQAVVTNSGSSHTMFTEEALGTIFEITGGNPASIVSLCDMSLLAAMGRNTTLITSEIIQAASGELSTKTIESRPMRRIANQHAYSR